jgi:MFS family permease
VNRVDPSSPSRLTILGRAFRQRDIRLIELAFLAFNTAEWATWIAILVYAYGIGGALAAGTVAVIQLIPAALFAPFGALLSDLYPRHKTIFYSYLAQALAMAATALVLLLSAPVALIYACAAATATAITLTRPVQGALLPMIAATPEELIAANVTAATIESVSIFVGPALTGVLLALLSVGSVFAVMAAIELAGALAVSFLGFRDALASHRRADAAGIWPGLTQGLGTVIKNADSRLLVLVIATQSIELGALDVLFVVMALAVLHLGRPGAGFLNSAFGAGGVLGATGSVVLIGRKHLAPHLLAGALAFGLALAIAGMTTTVVVAMLLLAVCGGGRAFVDVTGRSLLQRVVPNDSLSRAFGALEGLAMAGLAIGSILVPVLVASVGIRLTLLLVGALLPAVALAGWKGLKRVDASSTVPVYALQILRSVALFSGLDARVLERLASGLIPIEIPEGRVVFRQGDLGDLLYVIEDGTVRVLIDDSEVEELMAGEFFGEIALLRRVPRTATIVAATDVRLHALDGDAFIEAITGQPEVRRSAEEIVIQRLRQE